MMKRWDPSRATATTTSAILSVAVHAVLVGAAVIATAEPHIERREIPEVSIARFLAPPNRAGGQNAQREMLKFVALAEPATMEPSPKPRLSDERKPEPVRVSGFMQQTV